MNSWSTSRGECPTALNVSRSVRGLCELRPLVGLNLHDDLVATIAVRLEHRRLSLAHVKPIFAEGIEDVRLVGDEDNVGACGRYGSGQLAQRLRAPVVLDRRDHKAALREIGGARHLTKSQQRSSLDRAIEQAGDNLPHRNL